MKPSSFLVLLAFACVGWSPPASALDYSLRTLPSTPSGGTPFLAAFDSNECEAWVLPPLGEPPVVTVQGSTVTLEVDRVPILNCSFPPQTHALGVPALPSGAYQLELIGRAYQSPGNDLLAQAITFQVGPAVSAGPHNIPADNEVVLAVLAGLLLSLGCALSRMRG